MQNLVQEYKLICRFAFAYNLCLNSLTRLLKNIFVSDVTKWIVNTFFCALLLIRAKFLWKHLCNQMKPKLILEVPQATEPFASGLPMSIIICWSNIFNEHQKKCNFRNKTRIIADPHFFKWALLGLFFIYFRLFKQTLQFLQQICVEKCYVHPVYGAGIRTHDLQNKSLLP